MCLINLSPDLSMYKSDYSWVVPLGRAELKMKDASASYFLLLPSPQSSQAVNHVLKLSPGYPVAN